MRNSAFGAHLRLGAEGKSTERREREEREKSATDWMCPCKQKSLESLSLKLTQHEAAWTILPGQQGGNPGASSFNSLWHTERSMATTNYRLKLSIDLVEASFQRNKTDPDKDFATLWVSTTNNLESKFAGGPAAVGSLGSGQSITLDPKLLETQEFQVNDDNQIAIMPFITNQTFTPPDQTLSQSLKIVGAVLACIGAGEVLAADTILQGSLAKFVQLDGEVGALIGGIAAGIGEVLGDLGGLLGLDDPNCDGPVFNPAVGAWLNVTDIIDHVKSFRQDGQLTFNQALPLAVWTDDTQISQRGCGHNPSTMIRVVVTIIDATPIPMFQGTSLGKPTHFKPLLSKPPSMWMGTWIDQPFMQNASIVASVNLSESFKGRVAPKPLHEIVRRAVAALPKQNALIENLRLNSGLRDLIGGSPLIAAMKTNTRMATGEVSATVTEHFIGSKTVASETGSLTLALLPLTAWDFDKPMYAFDSSAFIPKHHAVVETTDDMPGVASGRPVHSAAVALEMAAATHAGGIAAAVSLGTKPQFADTIIVGDGVALQLFGAYDDQDRFVETRLRYTRVDSAGNLVSDVMLQPPQTPLT
jgi:hypothetical protein